ncbi:peroxisomal membrane protein PMP22 isoform X2 [Amborella trichopoda]|uniref:peroxisomal membrane protein PMP22 isoform X2 n=1 Tax=Amborella trichopoda TaxID=13333 RepID=UPI0009C17119|nr:peroxisomal membrane protein PMP22 isoform X2 [Amborella trichopoda]|eukprot:XP_020530121.1 peroxisomal membrane protein PMP22 isoform X2 [Amborella trichopoda]
MGAIAKKGWNYYLLQLHHHPLGTKAITAGALAGCSDAVAQKLSGIPRIQLRRFLLKVLFGFAYGGPFGHFMHKLMDIIFKGKKDSKTVVKKVLLEQLTASPCNHLAFLIYYGWIVEVLANCWLDKSPVSASAAPCCVPQLYCVLLGNISQSPSPNCCFNQGLMQWT